MDINRAAFALTVGDGDLPAAVRKAAKRFVSASSKRFRDEEAGERLAVRELTLAAELHPEDDRPATDDGLYPLMPDPLRTICRLAPEGSDSEALCQRLNAGLALGADGSPTFDFTDFVFVPLTETIEAGTPEEFKSAVEDGEFNEDDGDGTQYEAQADTESDD